MKSTDKIHVNSQALIHPVTLTACVLLLLNALVFQPLMPSWLSGKLGDFCWLILLPLLILGGLSCLLPQKRLNHLVIPVSLLVGIAFSLMKTMPEINLVVRNSFMLLTGKPLKLMLDPTDLLVLPGLLISAFIWYAPAVWRMRPAGNALKSGVILLALFAMLADAPAPTPLFTISCLDAADDQLLAITNSMAQGYVFSTTVRRVFISHDDGHTWLDAGTITENTTPSQESLKGFDMQNIIKRCPKDGYGTFEQADPNNVDTHYLIVSGQGVYISTDNASTFALEYPQPEQSRFYDVLFSPLQGNLLIAAGEDGIIIRTPDGTYTTLSVEAMMGTSTP